MVKINQNEAIILRSNGFKEDVHMSSKTHKGRAKKYYMTESRTAMKFLNELRKNYIAK